MFFSTSLISCSKDNDDSGQIIEGVNVNTGKRLLELQLGYSYNGGLHPACNFKVEYDSKGRMNKILFERSEYEYNKESGKYNYYYTGELSEVAFIDYDLRVLKIYSYDYSWGKKSSKTFSFVLNEDGYISQIGTCFMKYDPKGYLIGVEAPKGISTLVFDSNDLIKASVSSLNKGNIVLYYISYENVDNQGDLYVKINHDEKEYVKSLDINDIVCLIAYQSGLFGKVAKSIIHLKSKQQASLFLDYKDRVYSYDCVMTFICE